VGRPDRRPDIQKSATAGDPAIGGSTTARGAPAALGGLSPHRSLYRLRIAECPEEKTHLTIQLSHGCTHLCGGMVRYQNTDFGSPSLEDLIYGLRRGIALSWPARNLSNGECVAPCNRMSVCKPGSKSHAHTHLSPILVECMAQSLMLMAVYIYMGTRIYSRSSFHCLPLAGIKELARIFWCQ